MNYFKLIIIAVVFGISYESNSDNRIYGGHNVEEGDLKYVVIIIVSEEVMFNGCLIHEDWVLTAAHCVTNESKLVTPSSLFIVAGLIDQSNDANAQLRLGKEIIVHEKYYPKLGKPDLALIKVNESFLYSSQINKIEFSTIPWPQNNENTWKDCIAAGWGLTADGRTRKLQSLNTTARHGKNACPCVVKFYMLKRYVCLPAKYAEGLCFGDTGAPLTCGGKVVGVAHMLLDMRTCSYTFKTDKKIECGDPYVYGVYIYTCPYLDWISARVPGVPGNPSSCIGTLSAIPNTRTSMFVLNLFMLLLFNK